MFDAAAAFAARVGLDLSESQCRELGASYIAEWQAHVTPVDGVAPMIERLAAEHRLGIVSNTHDESMIPDMLDSMGIAGHFETLVLSVAHGVRKPHASIYLAALDAMGCDPTGVAFVGDSFEADYAGPTRTGLSAFLIDPDRRHDVPDERRLETVLDIEHVD
jgi:putative hydrolase of the HAD superfamily